VIITYDVKSQTSRPNVLIGVLINHLTYELISSTSHHMTSHTMSPYLTSTQYTDEDVPEARFSYDLSPMAVLVKKKGKHWYEFVTSMCALIGGTFTVVGLVSSTLSVLFKSKKG
jgi:Endoplasmic reticulum vesicle transporter